MVKNNRTTRPNSDSSMGERQWGRYPIGLLYEIFTLRIITISRSFFNHYEQVIIMLAVLSYVFLCTEGGSIHKKCHFLHGAPIEW